MATYWYALRSKPMKEALLWEQLSLHHIESYYPHIHIQPVNPRARKIKPYFPGYLFVHVDFNEINISMLQWIPGSAGIVSFGGIPSHIPDHLIAAIRGRVDEINVVGGKLSDELHPGDIVRVLEGPFRGYEAVFNARLSGDERVRVLLKLLSSQQVPLRLPARQVQSKKQ